MRGRCIGRLSSHCCSSFPQTIILTVPSSNLNVLCPVLGLLSTCPYPLRSHDDSPSTSSLPPPEKASGTGRPCGPEELQAYGTPNSLPQQRALSRYFRSFSSRCNDKWAQPLATPSRRNLNFGHWRRRTSTNASAKQTERRCWSCEHEIPSGNGLYCSSCDAIQPLDPAVDFFQLFSIDRSFNVDRKLLEQRYKSLQKRLHPDLAGSKPQKEREFSAEQSAHVIQAYYVLLRPLSRARYLLRLLGIEIEEEGTIEDPELLMEIMEIRESIDEIDDFESLKAAEAENNVRIRNCEKELESSFGHEDLKKAVSWAQRLAYFVKVGEEIQRKL